MSPHNSEFPDIKFPNKRVKVSVTLMLEFHDKPTMLECKRHINDGLAALKDAGTLTVCYEEVT